MFGISSAPEMYQRIIQQVLQVTDGVHNISDEVVFEKTVQEHDTRLYQVLKLLQEKQLTLNKDKCVFRMMEMEFMGHVISKNGSGAAQSKVEAVQTLDSQRMPLRRLALFAW